MICNCKKCKKTFHHPEEKLGKIYCPNCNFLCGIVGEIDRQEKNKYWQDYNNQKS